MSDSDRCRVLNVEGNPAVRKARTQALISLGFEVTEAGSAQEALVLAQTNPPPVAVIDMHMPGTTGMELVQRLRANRATSSIQILQISAGPAMNDQFASSLYAGADSYLTEPVSPEVLGATLRALYRNFLMQTELRQALEHERRLRSEAGLQKSHLTACLASISDALAILDCSGTVVCANEKFLLLHGVSAPGDLESFSRRYEAYGADGRLLKSSDWPATRAAAGEVVQEFEVRARDRATGREWIGGFSAAPVPDAAGSVHFVILTIKDLTSVRTTEKALRESEARFRALTRAIPDLAWACDHDGRTTYYSTRWREYIGHVPGDSAGWTWMDFVHPEDMRPTSERWNKAVRMGDSFQADVRLRRFDGQYRWMRARAVLHRGEADQWFGTFTDVQEYKEIEEALRESNSALQRSNDELQQFAYFASHDLQEPLRTVNELADLLIKRYGDHLDPEPREYLRDIGAGTTRMREMVTGLLEYSRAASQPCAGAPCNASAALDWAVSNLGALIKESGAEITSGALPYVAADFGRLSQVLQNLISNGIKYGQDGTRPSVRVTAEPEGDFWRFCVEDNGSGIASQYHERVFHVFKRLHGREVPGAGIGLALCRRIVEHHGGRMWVESEQGRGSRFYFTLPRVEPAAASA